MSFAAATVAASQHGKRSELSSSQGGDAGKEGAVVEAVSLLIVLCPSVYWPQLALVKQFCMLRLTRSTPK